MKRITDLLSISLLFIFSPPLFAYENSVVKGVNGDVYLLTTKNRWERVYEGEKFNSNFRLKTEKGSAVTIQMGQDVNISIDEDSLFELNDNFSDRSSVISLAIFYGTIDISSNSFDKKIRIITPYNILSMAKGELRLTIDDSHKTNIQKCSGKVAIILHGKEKLINGAQILPSLDKETEIEYFINEINNNMDILKNELERFEILSERFDTLSEKRVAAKKEDISLKKEIEESLNTIFSTLTTINEAKNRINIFSTFLKSEIEKRSSTYESEDEEEIPKTFEKLKERQQDLNNLKKRYNKILTTDFYSILKMYDTSKNGRKKK
ncbi:MAG: hypothetical protein ACP5QK_04460 [Myxococcota bacterium]